MTYEEALIEAECCIEELGGIGTHATPEAAKCAHAEALDVLHKLEMATYVIHKELRLKGYELYLTK